MHTAVARNDATAPLDVHQLRVAGVPEATELLKRERFVFVGAPNRWRKEADGRITRADIRRSHDGGCIVVLFEWHAPTPRHCQTAPDPIGSLS